MENKTAFILYQYDELNNDYWQVMEYYSVKELKEKNPEIDGTLKNLYNAVSTSLDDIKRVINDKYVIIKETIEEEGAR